MDNKELSDTDEIFTLSEAANYLKLAERTILRMVQRKEIPAFKIASQWRIRKLMLDEWLYTQTTIPSVQQADAADKTPVSRMVDPKYMIPDIQPGTKPEILDALTDPLSQDISRGELDSFRRELLHREEMASTALGHGFAVPHLRQPQNNPLNGPLVLIGRCPAGCDFVALDHNPVYLFFLVVSRSEYSHLNILSKIFGLMHLHGALELFMEDREKPDFEEILVRLEGRLYANTPELVFNTDSPRTSQNKKGGSL
ncbi:MAG: PTS sugar transporter subunit IIA [Spirochaetales bacterium]|nr:PTS sugar transporter subunit IIA [Spirochaetales bacterium]